MSKRVTFLGVLCSLVLPLACSSGGDDEQFTFGSYTTQGTYPTTNNNTSNGEETGTGDGDPTGDGDGDGDGDPTTGDGDGDPTTTNGDGDGDPCPAGEFGCPCDNGQCAPGLSCDPNTMTCGLGGGDGDGDPTTTTTGNGNDPWDPANCMMPDIEVSINGLEGALCSAPCVSDADCPPGPQGTTPACALVLDMNPDPTQCALICNPAQDTCSPGSSCKQVPNQPGVGICTYP